MEYSVLLFALAMAAMATILLLSVYGVFSECFEFWPPPDKECWQHRGFRVLFRIFFYALVLLSILEVRYDPVRLSIGVPLLLLGFGLALYWTNFLGWRNAFGEAESLQTTGIYAHSRNPVYVASIVGMAGWAIAVQSTWVYWLLGSWGILYVVAPFVEEPWLVRKYGEDFESYCDKTPRYFGLRRAD